MPINTQLQGRLNSFFNLRNFSDVVSTLPKPATPLTDLFFPVAKRKQKTSPYLAISDIQNETGAVPVIVRGTKSYSVDSGKQKIDLIEVQPLTMSKFIAGAELNNLIHLGDTDSLQSKLVEITENLRDRVATSTEILVAQSLSGTISYPASREGTNDVYTVKIGDRQTATATNIASGTALGTLQAELEKQFAKQQSTGASSDVRFLVGAEVYPVITEIISNATNPPVQWTEYGCILFGKYKLMPTFSTYSLPGKTDVTNVIDSKSIQTIDLHHTGQLFYAALDELDSKLRPLPFFATHIPSDDPSGVKILASSKPLPAFAVQKSVVKKYIA